MELFISWSGKKSEEIAEELKNWIPKVLQYVNPYFTPSDIEKGAKWESEITKKLEECFIGIICLTPENTEKPWIIFEAGALSNKLNKSRVCPVLFGLNNTDLTGPLATFQTTTFNKVEFKKLMGTINNQAGASKIKDDVFEDVFEMFYPKFENKVKAILSSDRIDSSKTKTIKRSDRDILEEILELTRKHDNMLPLKHAFLKNQISSDYIQIDMSDFLETSEISLKANNFRTFRSFLDEIFFKISNFVIPFSYEYDWILVEQKTNKLFSSVVIDQNIPKGNPFQDKRTLEEVGIHPGIKLKVKKIS